MSNKLFKRGNPVTSPKRCLEEMNQRGDEYVTWGNPWAGARFIARKSFVEKKAQDRSYRAAPGEVVKLGTNLTVDEVLYELDANNMDEVEIKEGMNKKGTKVSRSELNVISEVLYNKEFDCSVFWPEND